MHKNSWKWQENAEERTFSMGSQQSGRYIRIYDRRGPTRLEIEFKDKWAKVIAENLATMTTRHWVLDCIGMIRNYIDFLDCRLVDAANPQGNLAPWWDEFVYDAELCKVSPTHEVREMTLARAHRFLDRLKATLCVLADGLGISVDELVKKNRSQIFEKHLAAIRRLRPK